MGRGGEDKAKKKKALTEKKIFVYCCSCVYKILHYKMRGQLIQIAENNFLVKCGLQ